MTVHNQLLPGGACPLDGGIVHSFTNSRTPELAIVLPLHGGILLTCDSGQNWETMHGCSLHGGVMSRLMGFKGRACIGPGWRKMNEPKDGKGFGPEFKRLLQLDFRHTIGAHGQPMRETAKEDLRAQVQKLYGGRAGAAGG